MTGVKLSRFLSNTLLMKTNYGSGDFGTWMYDEYNLPAYNYQCNQYHIPEKMPLVNKNSIWGDYRNHFSQIGNDRIIGLISNFGYVKIRQDEGSPKFLNEYNPKNNQYSGGFGYFTDGKECLSTYYQEQEDFERIFGCGYFTKKVWNDKYDVKQTLFAPYGDDPCIISKVIITNKTNKTVTGSWFDYWGNEMYQMSYRPVKYSYYKKTKQDYYRYFRTEFSKNFGRHYTNWENGGAVGYNFEGYSYPKKDEANGFDSIQEVNDLINPAVGDRGNFEDLNPPTMFVTCLNKDLVTEMRYSGSAFFGNEDILDPSGISNKNDEGEKDSLIANTKFELAAGESKELYYLIGYLPQGFNKEYLMLKYQNSYKTTLEDTMKSWKENLTTLEILNNDEEDWLKRELIWHNYFLRSCVTFDSSMGNHILNQGCNYQYIVGNQVFVRDVAQHLLPFIYSDQILAKELIDYQLKMVDSTGMIFGGTTGNGVIIDDPRITDGLPPHFVVANAGGSDIGEPREDKRPPLEQRYDDQELWPLWIVSEYVLATKDFDYLNEVKIGYFSLNNEPRTVLEICKQLFDYMKNEVGLGKHGLVKLLWNDWSRALFHKKRRDVPKEDAATASKIAESLFTSSLAIFCTEMFAQLLKAIDDPKAEEVEKYSHDLKEAINNIWNGKWIQRLWVSDNYGYVGDVDEFFMEGQPWTLVSKTLPDDRAQTLIKNMKELVMDPSPIGAAKQRVALEYDDKSNDGWIWWSLNGPLIWGLVPYNKELAFKEYIKNSLANHANEYPDIWFGIWSADDNYTSFLSEYPGYTRFRAGVLDNKRNYLKGHPDDFEIPDAINFPVACVHPHAWPLYDTMKFLQLEFTKEGLRMTPSVPRDEYKVTSKLIEYKQTNNKISGYYNPLIAGEYTISIDLSNVGRNFSKLIVNGNEQKIDLDREAIIFKGEANTTLIWELL